MVTIKKEKESEMAVKEFLGKKVNVVFNLSEQPENFRDYINSQLCRTYKLYKREGQYCFFSEELALRVHKDGQIFLVYPAFDNNVGTIGVAQLFQDFNYKSVMLDTAYCRDVDMEDEVTDVFHHLLGLHKMNYMRVA